MKQQLILSAILFTNLCIAQTNSYFFAHEWGTFTTLQSSNGKRLSGLQKDEEALPKFVQNIVYEGIYKGYPFHTTFSHVVVKMETPVVYFYSDKERDVTVDVKFKQGSISQWYPERTDGEYRYLPTPSNQFLDFALPRTGWIKWNATILSPNTNEEVNDFCCINDSCVSHPEWETPQWIRPRATSSNLVKGPNGEIEKFLFYRGIANFEVPLKVEFNDSGKLIIANNGTEKLNYVMVYEKKDGQVANIWWSGFLDKGSYQVICPSTTVITEAELNDEMKNFEDNLVCSGLFRDEAKAMLNTWKESYFEHSGLKVFWIAPRSFTDSILPIEISPVPDKLERVIVGRSEILTPEFEQVLKQNNDSVFTNKWSSDRFYFAYLENRKNTITAWTNINAECQPSQINSFSFDSVECVESYVFVENKISTLENTVEKIYDLGSIIIYPNPFKNEIYIESSFSKPNNLQVQMYNSMGKEVMNLCENTNEGNYKKAISMDDFTNGIYFLRIKTDHYSTVKKIIKE